MAAMEMHDQDAGRRVQNPQQHRRSRHGRNKESRRASQIAGL